MVTSVAFLLSLIAMFAAIQRTICGTPLLVYEPRQRVPWGVFATSIPWFCVLLAVAQAIGSFFPQAIETFDEATGSMTPEEFIWSGLLNSAVMIGFTLLAMAGLAITLGADARDLGLPKIPSQLASDIAIGFAACLASLLPIIAIHYVLNVIFEPEEQHQLIEMLIEHRSPQLLLVGFVVAVLAAPIFEEFAFRLLLQGWLERREDELLNWKATERNPVENQPLHQDPVSSFADLPVNEAILQPLDTDEIPNPSSRSLLFGLPHGWGPVLISGTAFGLAHLGHGVSAVPLIFFGIVLGYLYQRTHRLAPSIAAHMLFNAYTMTLLWLG